MKSLIVLLSGKQGSGKDTLAAACAEYLSVQPGLMVNTVKFADVIYEMHHACLSVLKKYGIDRNTKKDGTLLQLLGTDWGRNTFGSDIWVRTTRAKIENIIASYENTETSRLVIFVTDCRFRNEFDSMPEALRVRLKCPADVRRKRCASWRENTEHPSETNLDLYEALGNFNLVFDTNKQSVEECRDLLVKYIEHWLSF